MEFKIKPNKFPTLNSQTIPKFAQEVLFWLQ